VVRILAVIAIPQSTLNPVNFDFNYDIGEQIRVQNVCNFWYILRGKEWS